MEVDDAARETEFVQQLEVQADIVWEGSRAASDHDGIEEQVQFVHQAGPDRLSREVGTADADVLPG